MASSRNKVGGRRASRGGGDLRMLDLPSAKCNDDYSILAETARADDANHRAWPEMGGFVAWRE